MRDRARHFAAAGLLMVLAVGQTWPLVRHLGTALPGTGPGDNGAFVWNLWWMRHVGLNTARFFHTDYLLWPYGASLVLHTHTLLNAFLAATVLAQLSVVEAQNVLVLTSVFLNGLAAYALAYEITGSRGGSLVSAAIFGGAPYFAGHLEGHFNLMIGWVIPLWLLFVRRAIIGQRIGNAVLAGCALALAAYADYYYVVFSAVAALGLLIGYRVRARVVWQSKRWSTALTWAMSLLALLLAALVAWVHVSGGTRLQVGHLTLSIRSTFNPRFALWATLVVAVALRWRVRLQAVRVDRTLLRADARNAAFAAAVFCAAVVPLAVPAARLLVGTDYVGPGVQFRSAPAGIDVVALVGGNPRHPLLGRYSRQLDDRIRIDPIEGVGWLGIVPLALAMLGLGRWPDRVERRAWGALLAVSLVWALGPWLSVYGWNTALPLPHTALQFLPIVSNARMPGRAMVLVYLSLAMLAGMGLATRSTRSIWATSVLLGLIVADYASAPIPLWRVDVPPVYRDLAARADRAALIELPMGLRDGFGNRGAMDPGSPLFQTVHEHPVVGGFVARLPMRIVTEYLDDAVFGPLLRASDPSAPDTDLPSPSTLRDGLRARGVRYVILRQPAASSSMTRLIHDALGPFRIARDAERELFEVPGS
jgi:hypothetical protein